MNRHTFLLGAFYLYAVMSLISMATMSIGAVILIVAILSQKQVLKEIKNFHSKQSENWILRTFYYSTIALVSTLLISLVWAIVDPVTIDQFTISIDGSDFKKFWYFLIIPIVPVGLTYLDPQERYRVLKIWLSTFVILTFYGIYEFFTGGFRPHGIPNFHFFHVTLLMGHHLSVASTLIFPFFVVLDLSFKEVISSGLMRRKFIAILLSLICFIVLLGTFSRMLWVALPIGVGIWLLLKTKGKTRGIILAIGILGMLIVPQIPPIKDRLHENIGIQTRIDLWKANWEFFKMRPLFGVGWNKGGDLSGPYLVQHLKTDSVFAGHAHDNYLEMLAGTGVAGTSAWVVWILLIFSLIWKSEKFLPFSKGLFVAWFVFQLNGITQVNFWEGKVLHQMFWILSWILAAHYLREKTLPKNLDPSTD